MAPLALLVALAAVAYVVTSTTRDGEGTGGSPNGSQERGGTGTSTAPRSETRARTTTTSAQPRSYTVQTGDTLGTIAERTGVSVAELQELNPGLDPQSLTVGERIRLRR